MAAPILFSLHDFVVWRRVTEMHIYIYHIVQVAKCAHVHVCTLASKSMPG